MRIVSWNMNHWRQPSAKRSAAWDYLRSLRPDYALLQETVPQDGLPSTHCVYRPGGIGDGRPWGSAVISFAGPVTGVLEVQSPHGSRLAQLHRTYPGSLAVATCEDGLTLISAYGLIEDGYAITTLHRLISDLTPLFDTDLGRRVVLAGDLNVTTQFAEPDRSRHRNVLERLETLGLVDCLGLDRPPREHLPDCPCGEAQCRHVQTQRHPKSTVPWQNDYCFVSRDMSTRVKACYPVGGEQGGPWVFSDHCPLMLELAGDNFN